MEGFIEVLKELYGAANVLEYPNKESFPATGATGKYYVADNTMKVYQWNSGQYVELLNADCPYTQFPNAVDTITRKADIDATTYELVETYQGYIESGMYDEAAELIAANPKLKRTIFGAEDTNRLRDGLIAVERTFNTYIAEYIAKLSKPRGVWSAATAYKKYDVVSYALGADMATEYYVALPDDYTVVDIPVGTLPTNTVYWKPITLRGPKGESGSGYTPKGGYSASTLYHQNDCVVYDNRLWYAIYDDEQGFSGQTPQAGSSYWALFGTFSNQVYYQSITLSDDLWIANTDADASYFAYKYVITIANVADDTRADIMFDGASMQLGYVAGVSNLVETTTNTVTLKSRTIPAGDLTGTLALTQNTNN